MSIDFVFGALFMAVVLVFIGYLDNLVMGRPIKKLALKSPVMAYVIMCGWEAVFLSLGILIGVFK